MSSKDDANLEDLENLAAAERIVEDLVNIKPIPASQIPNNVTGLFGGFPISEDNMSGFLADLLLGGIPISERAVGWYQTNRYTSERWLGWEEDLQVLLWVQSGALDRFRNMQTFNDKKLFKEHLLQSMAQHKYNQYKKLQNYDCTNT